MSQLSDTGASSNSTDIHSAVRHHHWVVISDHIIPIHILTTLKDTLTLYWSLRLLFHEEINV